MDFFPIGVIYGGTLPRDEWDNDLHQISHAGFNCIRVSAQDHSEEDLDYILDLAEKHRLKVFVAFQPDGEPAATVERLRHRLSLVAWITTNPTSTMDKTQAEIVRNIDSSSPVIVESLLLGQHLPEDVVCGVSIKQPQSEMVSYKMRGAQSIATELLCTGLAIGPTERRRHYGPQDASFDTWSCIANSAKGVIFDRWDPGGFPETAITPLKGIDGKLWPGIKRVSQDICKLHELSAVRDTRIAKPTVALLVPSGRMQSGYPDRSRGAFQLLLHNHVSVRFIEDDTGLEELKRFQAIYAPRFYSCSLEFGKTLAAYVQAGGCLIAESQVAATDEQNNSYDTVPGAGLSEVFGITNRKQDRISATSRPVATTSIAQGVFTSVGANTRFYINALCEDLDIEPGRSTILDFLDPRTLDPDGPAAVIGRYGKGKTAYISGSLGSTYYALHNPYIRQLMSGILDWMEVERMAEVTGLTKGLEHQFELGVLEGLDEAGRRAIICINRSEATLHPTIALPIGAPSIIKELYTESEHEFEVSQNQIRIQTHIPAREVRVYYEVEPVS